jgi:hypothetical protein
VKARAVKGLDPDATLADNLERMVATRLDELCSFMPRAWTRRAMKALHDMRIAAKRCAYILEVGAEPCFGPTLRPRSSAQGSWDLLGELHDCDVQLPRVRARRRKLRAADALEARARAAALRPRPDARLGDAARGGVARPGTLCIYVEARRGSCCSELPRAVARTRARGLPRTPAIRDQRATRAAGAGFTF